MPLYVANADKLRLLIVDDEPPALRRLEQSLAGMAGVEVAGFARDGDAALEEARRLKPDVIILDVEMPGRNGIAIVSMLDSTDGAEIIIHSSFEHYAAAAFEVEALDFLVKPLRPERLRQAIERARRRRLERAAHISIQTDLEAAEQAIVHVPDRNGGRNVPASDVIWVEAARDYVLLHTDTRSHIMRTTMGMMAQKLPIGFLRVHRSAIVSLAHVRRWGLPARGGHCLVLSDDTEIAIGPNYVADVKIALRSLGT